jgi:protein-S-isoprenylcysteine O-methyltransferase Ste14
VNTDALVLYVIFALVAFGWRTWLQWRRTGDTGLRMHAPFGTVQWWAKLAFVAALLGGVAAPIAGLAGLDPIASLDTPALHVIGVGLTALGIGATAFAQWQMGESWRIGVDHSEQTGLVTRGVFGVVRNPIFTAMVITATGLTLMVGNAVALASLVALALALQLQVRRVEEPYLLRTHPDAYRRYASTAGRFLPRLGRLA